MNTNFLNLEIKNKTAVITLNRPESLNALDSHFFLEMNSLLDSISTNSIISVLIITGEGKAFVAGADISEMEAFTPDQALEFSRTGHETFNRIENLPFPVIALIV